MNSSEPLGLPRGSVRAILALMIVGFSLTYMTVHGSIPEALLGVMSIVVTYYFLKRDDETRGEPVSYREEPLPDPYVPHPADEDR